MSNNFRSMVNNRSNQNTWSSLCMPAKLYGIVSVLGVAGMIFNGQILGAVGQAIFAAIWVFVLGWICNQGWTGLSWFLVLLPVIIVILVIMAGTAVAIADAEVPHERKRQPRRE